MSKKLGIVGASGPTGALIANFAAVYGFEAVRISRKPESRADGNAWYSMDSVPGPIEDWIYTGAIWSASEHLPRLAELGAQRILVVSSTSRYTKAGAVDRYDLEVAAKIEQSETTFVEWAEANSILWTILRPTLIYGPGSTANLVQIAKIVEKIGFFPVAGSADGRRQPISTKDLAIACLKAVAAPASKNKAYNVGGGEVLTYRSMVHRVMETMGRPPQTRSIPMVAFKLLSRIARVHPKFRHWTSGMAQRMNIDMVFDNRPALEAFDHRPTPFALSKTDIGH